MSGMNNLNVAFGAGERPKAKGLQAWDRLERGELAA